jgi:hypothetical protein
MFVSGDVVKSIFIEGLARIMSLIRSTNKDYASHSGHISAVLTNSIAVVIASL